MPDKQDVASRPGAVGRERAKAIRQYILDHLTTEEFADINRQTAEHFGVSRYTVHKQLRRLEAKSLVEGRGRTKAREHRLVADVSTKRFKVSGLDEDQLWRSFADPRLRDLPANVLEICRYGFTEMVNNVIDHSGSPDVLVSISRTPKETELMVSDGGVGVFRKIQQAMSLPSMQEALFELTKGKLTTDPSKHTGEGIFYTTRVFDQFRLLSGDLYLTHDREEDDWLLGSDDESKTGTTVFMRIDPRSPHTLQEVFEHYASGRDDYAFSKTNVVLRLLDTGDDVSFVSRSQAKRVLARLPRFKEVLLDFEGVNMIGPAFADEIFRVFANEHPEVHLRPIRATNDVHRMIQRAQDAKQNSG
jgi:anti-sigma regulatory factor (Ser/Thr protein kinase)